MLQLQHHGNFHTCLPLKNPSRTARNNTGKPCLAGLFPSGSDSIGGYSLSIVQRTKKTLDKGLVVPIIQTMLRRTKQTERVAEQIIETPP
ncbi:hypothetical protein ebA1322 [Aromatoleum aromaticum EbN1]|uniref:Uncharacterized protein n=1 Tax=Aromatoleum aromaticum (strain DSM 19018 / LMG 30748 / EbN1) TaxID=76114 RepID=Q5P771_AROAE|nr:hypothetical protein ebA1322 [Aromatoleum aromaticum EbN1]